MHLNWDDLRFFLAVARHGSLSAAARVLEVTQPTVGRRVAAFERELGVKLFVANRLGQELSSVGRELLTHAERMEQSALAAASAGSWRDGDMRGTVSITASEWLINAVLAPALASLGERYPELELDLIADVRHLDVMRREADIAVRPSRFTEDDVVQRKVGQVSFALYASKEYLERHGQPDFAAGAPGHRLIAMGKALSRVPDLEWLPPLTSLARVVARCNGRESMARLASASVGMACLPCFVGDRTPGLERLATPGAAFERTLWLGMHRDARRLPPVRATVTFLVDALVDVDLGRGVRC